LIVEAGFIGLNGPWGFLALMAMAVAMLVNRAGASMVFFDVVGRFQAQRLIKDADTSMTVFNSIMLDTFANMQDSINVLGTSVESLATSVLPFAEAMQDAEIELRKFLDASEDIDQVADEVRQLGVDFGYAGDEALAAAAKMAQLASVLGAGQTGTGTQLGIEFGLISGMETEAAMQRLINLNQQLFFMTEGTEDLTTAEEKGLKIRKNTLAVMDQLNTIENRSASTMQQVTFVMNQFASQAHLTGESIAMMAAQSAVLIETGEEQGKAGRALRMIYARLGADTNGARRELENMNIAVVDANDNMRPLSRILGDLSQTWGDLEAAERMAIAQGVAGNRHYTRFIKLMDNYERAAQLAFEGQMALFPALEEVNNRLDTSITKYRQAEAELSNYRAELGEALLPALTDAAESQAAFTGHILTLVEIFPNLVGGVVTLGMNMKSLVVPMLGVVTNIAAMTVAMQAQRAVSRAMAGEQLMLEQAFSTAGTSYQSASAALAELAILKKEMIGLNQMEMKDLKILSEDEREIQTDRLRFMQQEAALTEDAINEKQKDINAHRILIQEKKESIALAEAEGAEVIDLQGDMKGLNAEYEKLQTSMMKLNAERRFELGIIEEASGQLAEDRLATLHEERKETDAANEAMAARAKAMYAVGGASIALGGAMMTLTENQRINTAGMTLMTAGAAVLAAQQIALAGSTMIKVVADQLDIDTKKKKLGVIAAEISALIAEKIATTGSAIATSFNVMTTNADTGARTINTAAIWAQIVALRAYAVANKAALGVVGLAVTGLIVLFTALWSAEKKRNAEAKALQDQTTQYIQTDAALFIQTLHDQELALDDIISKYRTAKSEVELYAEASTEAGKKLRDDAGKDMATYGDVAEVKLAGILEQGEITKEEVAKVVDAMDELETGAGARRRGIFFDEFNILTGENMTQKAIDNATRIIAEYENLVTYIEISGKEGEDAIYNSIQSNASSLSAFMADSNEYVDGIAVAMESATQSVLEFNNAREELFYGMAASNITGDLVRQVVNRGVENLLVNTEVIMTNNFNGMTTAQAAQEILDHVERGARMRGVDLTTTSQSI